MPEADAVPATSDRSSHRAADAAGNGMDGYPEELTTARLRLRRPRGNDAEWYAAMNADPEVMRFLEGGRPMSREEADRSLEAILSHWDVHGFGLWFAERLDTDEPVGFVGLATPSFLPEVLPAVEVGWRLARAHWGAGFATEAARVALCRGFTTLGLDRLVSITVHDNLRSQHTMARLGLTWDRAAVHPRLGLIVQVRSITIDAWAATQPST